MTESRPGAADPGKPGRSGARLATGRSGSAAFDPTARAKLEELAKRLPDAEAIQALRAEPPRP